jgi:sugar/nucleoside kinase (ribokinase family)
VRPLAVIGNSSRDVVDGRAPRLGGGPYYAAQAIRLIGVPARIATKCAPADRWLVSGLVALGVPVSWRAAGSTAGFTFSYENGNRRMNVDSLGEPWAAREAREAVAGAAWVHAAALLRSDFPAETLAALARVGRVSLDGQGLVRPSRTGPLELDADFDPGLLRHVRFLKLAEEEAEVLGALDEAGLRALGVAEIVVTLGGRGSLVWWRGRLEPVAPHPVREPVEPTGAGDAFAVAYLAARALGYEPRGAARRASFVVSALLSRRRR